MPCSLEVALVDAHVHCQSGIGWARFLDGATRRFDEAVAQLGFIRSEIRYLLMTETADEQAFEEFCALGDRLSERGWTVSKSDDLALTLHRVDGSELVLVPGRQIETAEKLEVLALFTRKSVEEGLTLRESVRRVAAAGGIPVLPWGFGKWWFKRGRILRQFVAECPQQGYFLGDNGGRPRLFRRSAIFRLAKSKGIATLPGSDPLPLDRQADRAGSYGFVLEAQIDRARPGASLKAAIQAITEDPSSFGGRVGLLESLGTQLSLQWRKRLASN